MTRPLEILRPTAARKVIGLGSTLFYDKQNPKSPYYDPSFPVAVALGGRSVGYYRHELDAWMESRPRLTPEERQKRAAPPHKSKRTKVDAAMEASA